MTKQYKEDSSSNRIELQKLNKLEIVANDLTPRVRLNKKGKTNNKQLYERPTELSSGGYVDWA